MIEFSLLQNERVASFRRCFRRSMEFPPNVILISNLSNTRELGEENVLHYDIMSLFVPTTYGSIYEFLNRLSINLLG